MVKKYKMVRMPMSAFNKFNDMKFSVEKDLKKVTGKPVRLPLTQIFNMVANENENWVQFDLKKLSRRFKK